jgi:hypothetical protein
MKIPARRLAPVFALTAALVAAPSPAPAQPPAGAPAAPPAPVTQVLTVLTVKPNVDRALLMKTLPEEVRETVRMHLAGRIQQWYGNADGRGVVFVLNATSIEEAKALMNSLPFGKNQLADFQFIGLTPLTPLRLLVDGSNAAAERARD